MFQFYNFLRKKFAEYSEFSGQQGSPVDDLAVKPSALVISDFNNALVEERKVNDVTRWGEMTEDQLDMFGNKYFMPRVIGEKASGYVRVWFDYKSDIEISENFKAVSYLSLTYSAVQPGDISRSAFRRASDGFGLYYVDIPVIADEEGNSYNIEPGKITALNGIDFQYKTATNPEKIQNGLNRETNEQYYKRLRYSINDGSMMNPRSMYAKLPEFFPSIISMYIANSGSKYMTRDLVSGEDINSASKTATYLGKTKGNNMVKHSAFYGSFPPEAWSVAADYRAGIPIPSQFKFPLTIEASDNTQDDPGYRGYPMSQEADNDMYSGLFFNDYSGYMERSTLDLFNIYDEEAGFGDGVITPNNDWIYGSNMRGSGEFGPMADGVMPSDLINFRSNIIKISTGCEEPISVSKDIKKRIGVKMSGSFIWPSNDTFYNSSMQLMVGGINNPGIADAFSGLGFGIRVRKEYDPDSLDFNSVVYIAHSEQNGSAQVFYDSFDETSITGIGALTERQFRIQPGEEYAFEFIVYDDLRVTLYFEKTNQNPDPDSTDIENYLHLNLPAQALNIFAQELLNPVSSSYGTMMKVSLESDSTDQRDWQISDLKVFDIDQHRVNMLFAINVKDMEDPLTVYMRAFGSGAINGVLYNGYEAYIWDKESNSVASNTNSELTSGGWSVIDGISDPDGTKDVATGLLRHDIRDSERYVVNSRYGKSIFIMLTSTGTSKASINYGGDFTDDIHSSLKVDYIKVASLASQSYHSNNKADIHVITYQNSEAPEIVTSVLEKNDSDSFFEMNEDNDCKMPLAEIISVSAGGAADELQAIAPTDYSIVLSSDELIFSSKETVRIVLADTSINTITVQYRSYPVVGSIQDFFEETDHSKIFGDILIKHKRPVLLSFSISYRGDVNEEQMVSEIRKYFDSNNNQTLSIREMVRYLYDNKFSTYINEPINVSYSRYNEDLEIETGEFSDVLDIKDIEFFRLENLTAQKI